MKKTILILASIAIVSVKQMDAQCGTNTSNSNDGNANVIPKYRNGYCFENSIIYDDGKVGIGNTSPAFMLDVTGGDINITNSFNGYRRGCQLILIDPGANNIFCGPEAGANNVASFTTGGDNAYCGYIAGFTNSSGSQNTFMGSEAGRFNVESCNSGFGYHALTLNTSTGTPNDAFGCSSLAANTTGQYNAAFGYGTLLNNQTGISNSAFGATALSYNGGNYNSGFGVGALFSNSSTSSNENSAFGVNSLHGTYAGYNTAIGTWSGESNQNGTYNTFVGDGADAGNDYINSAAFGSNATTIADYKQYFGDATVIGCYNYTGTWGSFSDGRFKNNVTENVKGLAFINKLRPVTYNLDTKKLDDFVTQNMPDSAKARHKKRMDFTASTARVHSGFIAQEVEQAAQQIGYTSSIVSIPSNATEPYALSYSEFVVPLVKAVQELSHTSDSLKTVINKQDSINQALQNQINQITGTGNRTIQNNTNGTNNNNPADATSIGTVSNIELASNAAIIYQNAPNPFGDGTMVKYFIPTNSTNAQIVFYDQFGNQLNTFSIPATGAGQLNVASANLAPGTYSYSLIINGKVVDTKKMIKTN